MNTITLRVPDAWSGQLDSATVRLWLGEYLQRPTPNLPADPGGGEARVTLSLPKRAVKVVSGLLDCSESAALRRIIAANLGGLPQGRPRYALPAPEGGARAWPTVQVAAPVLTHPAAFPERGSSYSEAFYGGVTYEPATPGASREEPERLSWLETFGILPLPYQVLIVGLAGYVLYLVLAGGKPKASVTASGAPVQSLPQFKAWVPK